MGDENRSYGYGATDTTGDGQPDSGYGDAADTGSYGAADGGSYGQSSYGSGEHSYGQSDSSYGTSADSSYGQSGTGMGTGSYGQSSYGSYGQPNQSYGTGGYGQSDQQFGSGNYGQPNQQFGAGGYGQPYGGGAGYGQMNYGMGTPPVGKNGKPLKNHFGLKMTFSILEILCCCACNIVTMIMGILGCVYTSQANRAYNEGRWEEYQGKSKTASIFLWVGFGIAAVYLITGIYQWTAGGYSEIFWDAYYEALDESGGGSSSGRSGGSNYQYDDTDDYDYDYDYNYGSSQGADDEEDEDEEDQTTPSEPLDVTPGEGFTDPSITINGVYIQLPLSYPELVELGFYIDEEDEEYIANKSEYYYPTVYGPDGEAIGYVYLGNETEGPLALKDCVVFGFWFSSSYLSYGDLSISFSNGLNETATKEDFLKAYGEPDYVYESEDNDYQSYQWYNHSDEYYDMDENSLSVEFWDGELDDLDIMYIGW